MDELITKVEQWAKDKGLDQADPKAQFLKVAEEFGEIASAMARSNDELFKDSVGDVIVTLIILSMQKRTNVQECLEMAYNEIKGRTGKMVDGVFVKSSDLKQLNESQKPVIPQLVAGWLEKSTDPFTKAEKIAYLIKFKDGDSYYFCDWFVRDGIVTQEQGEELLAWATRQSYETLLSLYNGYEVEKEPLYRVKIGEGYFVEYQGRGALIMPDCNKEIKIFDSKSDAERTAQTIGGTVERWQKDETKRRILR
ncbi:TPA: DUF1642 domain-containing protein [Enterococcus faecium]|nr:DUF1642 domain-containing protein [Enterococcus faecium]EGP4867473.1 DUF1642 domain-containing protein [Enterococcus faecium]EGP5069440.1 DUF1642 domain-containing protein [Enterococcus faecium]MCL6154033.1 DUF1642 domain-containing protein [Enterococcus faecium]MCZ1503507.1 DUF1642 domain-containing protein [Enterococcus faecium]MDQ8224219.1 DUF1642 domain-containing protein [Enterococcus faecium]